MAGRSGYWDLIIHHNKANAPTLPGTFDYDGENPVNVNITNTDSNYETNWYTPVGTDLVNTKIHWNIPTVNYNSTNYTVSDVTIITAPVEDLNVDVQVIVTLNQANDFSWSATIRHSCTGKNFTITATRSASTILNQVITTSNQTFSLGVTQEASIKNSITWTPTQIVEGIYTYNFTFNVTETLFSFTTINPGILNIWGKQRSTGNWDIIVYTVNHYQNYVLSGITGISDSNTQTITLSSLNNSQAINFKHSDSSPYTPSNPAITNTSLQSSYINALYSTDGTADIAFINNMTYSPSLYYKGNYKIQLGGINFKRYIDYSTSFTAEFVQTNTGYWSIKLKRDDDYIIDANEVTSYLKLCFLNDGVTIQNSTASPTIFIAYADTYTNTLTTNLYSELGVSIDTSKIWWKPSNHINWYKLSNNLSSNYSTCNNSSTITHISEGNPATKKITWEYTYIISSNNIVTPWTITEETHDYTLAVTLTQQVSGQNGQWKLTNMTISPTSGVSGITEVSIPVTITANSVSKTYNVAISSSNQADNYAFGTTAIGTNISQPTYSSTNYSTVYQGVRHIFRVTNVTFTRTPLSPTNATVTLTLTQVSGGGWTAAVKHNLASGITLSMTFTRGGVNFTRSITSSLVSNLSTGWTTSEGTPIYLSEITYDTYIVGSNSTLYRVSVTYTYQTYGESKRIAINSISIEYTGTQTSPIPASGGTAYPYSVDVNYTKWIDYSNGDPSTNSGTVSDTLYYSGGDFDVYYDADRAVSVDSKVDTIDSGNNPTLVVHSGNSGRTDYTKVTFDVVWGGDTISVTSDDINYYIYQQANKCTTSTSTSTSTEDVTITAYTSYDNVNYTTLDAYISPDSGSFTAAGTPSNMDVTGYEKYTYQKRERGRFRLDTTTTTTTNYTYTSSYSWNKVSSSTSQGTPRYEYRTLSTVYTSDWEEYRSDVHQRSNNTSGLTFTEGSDAHITASSLGTNYISSSKTLVCYYHPYSGTEPTATFTQAANTYTSTEISASYSNWGWNPTAWYSHSYYYDYYLDWGDYNTFNANGTVKNDEPNDEIQIISYIHYYSEQHRYVQHQRTRTRRWTYDYTSGSSQIVSGNPTVITDTETSYYEHRNVVNSTEDIDVYETGNSNPVVVLGLNEEYDASRFSLSSNILTAFDITNSSDSVPIGVVRLSAPDVTVSPYNQSNNPFNRRQLFYQDGFEPSVEEEKTYITDVNIYASAYSGTLSGDNETISAAGGYVDMTTEIAYEIRTYVNGTLTNTSPTYYKYITSGFTKVNGDSNLTLSGNRVSAPNRGSTSGDDRQATFRYQYSLGSGEYVDNNNTLIDTLTIYQKANSVSVSTTPNPTQRNVVRTGTQVKEWYFHEELTNNTLTPPDYFYWTDPEYNPFLVDIEIDYYSAGYIQYTYSGVNTYTYTSNTVTTNNYSYTDTTYEDLGYITESEIEDWIYFTQAPDYIHITPYASSFSNEIDGDGKCRIYHKVLYVYCDYTPIDTSLGWFRCDGSTNYQHSKIIELRNN